MKRKQILKIAIKCAEKRIRNLIKNSSSDTCYLCKQLDKYCKNCPVFEENNPDYSCGDYVADIDNIIYALERQIKTWESEIKSP